MSGAALRWCLVRHRRRLYRCRRCWLAFARGHVREACPRCGATGVGGRMTDAFYAATGGSWGKEAE
jgi:hypothetical protein